MDSSDNNKIIKTFKELKRKPNEIFFKWSRNSILQHGNLSSAFNSFHAVLEKEIREFPNNSFLLEEIEKWMDELYDESVDNAKGKLFVRNIYLIRLKEKLSEIKLALPTETNSIKEDLEIKESVQPVSEVEKNISKNVNSYSHKQIAIAYCITGETITSENAAEILNKYSETKSTDKLLQKRIFKVSDLSKLSENKTTDTKHLNDLRAAKRLLSGKKNKKAVSEISRIIIALETAFQNHY